MLSYVSDIILVMCYDAYKYDICQASINFWRIFNHDCEELINVYGGFD